MRLCPAGLSHHRGDPQLSLQVCCFIGASVLLHRICTALLLQGLANMEAPRSSGRQRKQVATFTYDNDHLTGKHKASQVRTLSCTAGLEG